jgi:hypothetical protein
MQVRDRMKGQIRAIKTNTWAAMYTDLVVLAGLFDASARPVWQADKRSENNNLVGSTEMGFLFLQDLLMQVRGPLCGPEKFNKNRA